MVILLITILIASTAVLRLLWLTEKLHSERLNNAHKQYQLARNLVATDSQEIAAELWELHWAATQEKFAEYTNKRYFPRLQALYYEQPYMLDRRIEQIGGRANDGLEGSVQKNILTVLSGLNAVIDELQSKKAPRSGAIKIATLCILPVLFIWICMYHLLVHLPRRRRTNDATDALAYKEDEVDDLLFGDPLTETGNRKATTRFLSEYQNNYQSTPGYDQEFIALAILDLDHFQQINDVFGYFAGDAVLKEIAIRIKQELREDDQLSRIDADHYAIVLSRLVAPKNAETIIDRIQAAIVKPIHYKQNALNITCTVGAAVQQVDSIEIAELFKLSDQALQQAKRNKRGSVFLLSDQQQEALSRQRQIINTITNQSPDEIFDLVYQPIVDLGTRRVVACECLLRWTPPEPEDLQASELVPILEMFGDIRKVGFWVIEKSMQQLQAWRSDFDTTDLSMSINLSAQQLETDNIASEISSVARELGLAPSCVSLELTETVAIKHLDAGRAQLAQLKNHGFRISIDDFGTGYSSLQYLKNIPATSVKIDQSFVKGMLQDERDLAIVKGAIDIARAIGLKVIAEGIDTVEQADCLQELGCELGQGFLFAKPLSAELFTRQILYRENTDSDTLKRPPAA